MEYFLVPRMLRERGTKLLADVQRAVRAPPSKGNVNPSLTVKKTIMM